MDKLAVRTKVKNSSSTPLDKKDEVVANVIWRFLELRGCVSICRYYTCLGAYPHLTYEVTESAFQVVVLDRHGLARSRKYFSFLL